MIILLIVVKEYDVIILLIVMKKYDVIILLIVVKEYDVTVSLTHLVGACRESDSRIPEKVVAFHAAKSRRKSNSASNSNTSNGVIL